MSHDVADWLRCVEAIVCVKPSIHVTLTADKSHTQYSTHKRPDRDPTEIQRPDKNKQKKKKKEEEEYLKLRRKTQ